MLKLLLSHWQAHREPLPFVLTDDPLYCSHLTKSPFPEVYSVNRVNPIFEDEERPVVLPDLCLKRSLSENETRASDDTGYSSSGHYKGTADSLTDDVVSRHMSSDSDDYSHPEAVVVSADVHRESFPDDVIVLPPYAESDASNDPYDSLTMTGSNEVRDKLQRLLEKGNNNNNQEDPRQELMKSLTRAINSKVPNGETVTRTDSTLDVRQPTNAAERRNSEDSSTTTPKALYFNNNSNGVTRQDESSASSSVSYAKPIRKTKKRSSVVDSHQESSDSKKSSSTTHKCKVCANAHRPLAFHQLLPGHWSYDNVYLPQIPGVCYSCMHSMPPSSEDDVFFPMYYPHPRARHSWAPVTDTRRKKSEEKSVSTKDNTRYSPDGSSRETDSDTNNPLKQSERRSLREPKKCKCEHCLTSSLHSCPCHCLSHHRRVKFASDTDVSQHRHIHSAPFRLGTETSKGLAKGEPINAAFVMNLPHLNGHALTNGSGPKENGLKGKMAPPLVPRGMKEPIKMDELYRSYPINFREWEAHYRRNYLQKRRKRALNMIGMAIGIVLVVGIAVALTFVFLRIKRTG